MGIVPKKAYTGSSTQWLTQTQTYGMGSDESSLLPSRLWCRPVDWRMLSRLSNATWTNLTHAGAVTEGSVLIQAVGMLRALSGRPAMCKYALWRQSPQKSREIIPHMCEEQFCKAP